MYQVDEKDRVVPLEGVPQGSVGSPRPFVIANEVKVVLAYYLEIQEIWQRPESERGNAGGDEPFAIVLLARCTAHMFGPPNHEALWATTRSRAAACGRTARIESNTAPGFATWSA